MLRGSRNIRHKILWAAPRPLLYFSFPHAKYPRRLRAFEEKFFIPEKSLPFQGGGAAVRRVGGVLPAMRSCFEQITQAK